MSDNKDVTAQSTALSPAAASRRRDEIIEECAKVASDLHASALEQLEKSIFNDAKLINDARQGMAAYIAVKIRSLSVQPAAASEPPPSGEAVTIAECHDCNLPYADEGFQDLVIDDADWRAISPDGEGNGLLCPTCICRRLSKAGIESTGKFHSGPLSFRNQPAAASEPPESAKFKKAWEADRKRFFEARDALYQFNYPPDPKLLREIADEIDCGNDCEHGHTEWDTNAHVCSRADRKEGCAGEKASCLRQFADAIDVRSRLNHAAASEPPESGEAVTPPNHPSLIASLTQLHDRPTVERAVTPISARPPPAGEAAPVAWRRRWRDDEWKYAKGDWQHVEEHRAMGYEVEPLYASPPAPAGEVFGYWIEDIAESSFHLGQVSDKNRKLCAMHGVKFVELYASPPAPAGEG